MIVRSRASTFKQRFAKIRESYSIDESIDSSNEKGPAEELENREIPFDPDVSRSS